MRYSSLFSSFVTDALVLLSLISTEQFLSAGTKSILATSFLCDNKSRYSSSELPQQ